jgi:hypothetical protein
LQNLLQKPFQAASLTYERQRGSIKVKAGNQTPAFIKKTGELKTDKTRKTSGFVKKGSKIKGERKWLLIFF